MPEWEGDAAGEVEAGTFDIEDGPGAVAAEEEGELAVPSGRRRARRSRAPLVIHTLMRISLYDVS
jgi:hypothetical protein